MVTLFNYLLVFNVFAGGFVLFFTPFEFYLGYIFIIFFLIGYFYHYRNFRINSSFPIILIILSLVSLVNVYFGNDTIFLVMKQVFGILITGSAYYLLIKINRYKINNLFKIYLRIALIVASIGIFQEISFLAGFKQGYNYSWLIQKWKYFTATGGMLRINSIFMEPSHFAISMAPAFFVSLLNILKKDSPYSNFRYGSIIICMSYILTFSAIAYIAILISLLLLVSFLRNFKYSVGLLLIIPVLVYTAYRYSPEIRMRVNATIGVAKGAIKANDSNLHLSVYSLITNALVAYSSFSTNPLFGCGLGSHPISYAKFIRSNLAVGFWQKDLPEANKMDAGSLLFRLISETGLLGTLIVFYFVLRFRLYRKNNESLYIINTAIFVLFILQFLRQGHYFYNGLFFFVWMYYFAYKIYNNPELKMPQ